MRESFFLALANRMPRGRGGIRARCELLKLAGLRLAGKVIVLGPVTIVPVGGGKRIRIGERTFINSNVRFASRGGVTIGRFVQVAANVSFETASHAIGFAPGRTRGNIHAPIVIGDHVWIGVGAIILPGVTIGRGAVVAAGAVVHRDVPPMTVVGGVPARFLRTVEDDGVRNGPEASCTSAPEFVEGAITAGSGKKPHECIFPCPHPRALGRSRHRQPWPP